MFFLSDFDDGSFIPSEEHFQHIVNKGVNFTIPNISGHDIRPPSYTKFKTLSEDMAFVPDYVPGKFPTFWNSSFITPIHKKDDKNDISDYLRFLNT